MLGLIRNGGLGIGDDRLWYCKQCRSEFEGTDCQAHASAVSSAIEAANASTVAWLDAENAQQISIGRQVFERLVLDFKAIDAKSVRLSYDGEASARFEDEFEPMEWALADYGRSVRQALDAGACEPKFLRDLKIDVSDFAIEVTFWNAG